RIDPNNIYPGRVWKFYEHDPSALSCGGYSSPLLKRGWYARGSFSFDTLDVAMLSWWYSMTVTSNTPPDVWSTSAIHTTFDGGPQVVDATIIDCDPPSPGDAGVASASIVWSRNGVAQTDIQMNHAGGDVFEGTLPGATVGDVIQYTVRALDS